MEFASGTEARVSDTIAEGAVRKWHHDREKGGRSGENGVSVGDQALAVCMAVWEGRIAREIVLRPSG